VFNKHRGGAIGLPMSRGRGVGVEKKKVGKGGEGSFKIGV